MNRNLSFCFRPFLFLICFLGLFPIAAYGQTPCDAPTAVSLPLAINGVGDFCRVTSGDISYINSWNTQLVEINGVDYTNTWSNQMPERIDGNYYIHYVGQRAWSHLGVNGSGGSSQTVPVTGVTLSLASTSIDQGAATTLTATVAPDNATNKSVTWSTSNAGVATVDAAGVVTGVAAGSAAITVTTQDGGFTATCAVTVLDTGGGGTTPAPCDSPVAASLPFAINGVGDLCRVTSGNISYVNSWNTQLVEINGVDYTNTWSNQMPERIDGNYYIHYVGQRAWSHLGVNGSGGDDSQTIPVTGVTVSPAGITVSVGAVTTLTATVAPDNATDKSVAWSSSDPTVATVSSTGDVTGVSAGSAIITVTTADGGFTAASTITVFSDDGGSGQGCQTQPQGNCALPQVRISEVEVGVPVVNNESETELKPLAVAAIPSGGSWLAWMSDNDRVYIARLDCDDQLTAGPFSFAAHDFQDIAADDDGGVLLLTRDGQGGGTLNCGDPANLCDGGPYPPIACYGMYMVRFNNAGQEQWATQLTTQSGQLPPYSTGPDGPMVHMIWWYQHHGRLAWDGSNFAGYFCEALSVSQNGCINIHEGDRMQVVDPGGALLTGHDSIAWGCSHSWNTRMVWDDSTDHFSMVCATDRGGGIAQPDNAGHLLYSARDLGSLSLGDLVPAEGGGYWMTASDQGDVLLMHFSNGTVDRTLALGNAPHSKLASYGAGLMVAGWGSASTITAQVFDAAGGAEVSSQFVIDVPDNIYHPFKAYPDGSVAYAARGTGATSIRIARILPCTR